MSLNWSIGVFLTFLSIIPVSYAFYRSLSIFLKKRYTHLLYLTIMWLSYNLYVLFQALTDLFLAQRAHLICFYLLIVTGFATILFVDSITRNTVDTKKMIIMTFASFAVIYYSFDPNSIKIETEATSLYTTMDGNFKIAALIQMTLILIFYLYGNVKIFINSPRNLKSIASINLIGTITLSIIPYLIQFTFLEQKIPGIANVFIAIGAAISVYAITKEPKLANILLLKVYSLVLVNSEKGIPIFSYHWHKDENFNDELFNGMVQASATMFDKTVDKGEIHEIHLDKAIILVNHHNYFPIICILVASKFTQSLRNAFNSFCRDIFDNYFKTSENLEIILSKEEIDKFFPFIPVFD